MTHTAHMFKPPHAGFAALSGYDAEAHGLSALVWETLKVIESIVELCSLLGFFLLIVFFGEPCE